MVQIIGKNTNIHFFCTATNSNKIYLHSQSVTYTQCARIKRLPSTKS